MGKPLMPMPPRGARGITNGADRARRRAESKTVMSGIARAWRDAIELADMYRFPDWRTDPKRMTVLEKLWATMPDLDDHAEMRHAILMLNFAGFETTQSCGGGRGHWKNQPTIYFKGNRWAGGKALAMLMEMQIFPYSLGWMTWFRAGEPGEWVWELVL